jgi:hypothetical protein
MFDVLVCFDSTESIQEEKMRMTIRTRILGVALVVLLTTPAFAGSVESQLELMNERMSQMEQQLQATQDELENANERVSQQQDVIQKAGLDRQAQSGLSAFLNDTEFSGHIATSYNYNFNHPEPSAYVLGPQWDGDGGRPSNGNTGLTAPFHGQPNNFQLDQFLLEMKKTATPESRGGWGFSLAWGESADVMNGVAAFNDFDGGPWSSDEHNVGDTLVSPYVHRAYVEYLVDVGSGVLVTMGRFGTPIGYESFSTAENNHISRGLLWALQPVDHTGLQVAGDCENGFDWSLAVVNDFNNTNIDSDRSKTFVGHVGYTAENWGASLNGLYGGNLDSTYYSIYSRTPWSPVHIRGPGSDNDAVGLIDAVFTADPSDNLHLWLNFDYFWSNNSGFERASSLTIWGLAAGGRYAINDTTGVSLRGEYIQLRDSGLNIDNDEIHPFGGPLGADMDLWSVTATVDHALTESLTLRGELRYDIAEMEEDQDLFFTNQSDLNDDDRFDEQDQLLAIVQLLYRF